MNTQTGSDLLRQWIKGTGRKVTWLAETVPANRSLVHQWLNGNHVPREVYRHRIAQITDGAVPVETWGVE